MSKKIFITVIVIIALIFGVVYFNRSGKRANTSGVSNISTSSTISGISVPQLTTEKSETEYATVDESYPKVDGQKYPELFSYIKKSKQDFLDESASITKEDAIKMNLGGDRKYNFVLNTRFATSTKTITYIVEVYTYTGGAHGATTDATFTYDKRGKYVVLDNVLTFPYLEKISNLARTYFYDKLVQDSQKQTIDTGTEPVKENFSVWYMTDNSIVFMFGQYSIGPYVLGIQEFPLNKQSIKDIINPNYI